MKSILGLVTVLVFLTFIRCSNEAATPEVFNDEEIRQVARLIAQIQEEDREWFYEKMRLLIEKSVVQSNQEAVKNLSEYEVILEYVDKDQKNWALLFDSIIKHQDIEEYNNAVLLLFDISLPEYQTQLDKVNSSKSIPVPEYYIKELLKLKTFGGDLEDENNN